MADCTNLHSRIKTGVNVDPLAHWIHKQLWFSSIILLVGRFGVFVSITDCLSLHENVSGRNTSTGLEYDRLQFGIYKPTYGPKREQQMMISKWKPRNGQLHKTKKKASKAIQRLLKFENRANLGL